MKVIFLDIDGVLNSTRSAVGLGNYPHSLDAKGLALFDPVAVGIVKRLCSETGAKVVISSTWRRQFLHGQIGEALGLPTIGSTPVHHDQPRGVEINAWLSAHDCDRYVILDDDGDMLLEQRPNFVHVDNWIGLSYADYTNAKKILERED